MINKKLELGHFLKKGKLCFLQQVHKNFKEIKESSTYKRKRKIATWNLYCVLIKKTNKNSETKLQKVCETAMRYL